MAAVFIPMSLSFWKDVGRKYTGIYPCKPCNMLKKMPGGFPPGFLFYFRLRVLEDCFLGTLAPLRRASASPIATACLRLFTVFPDRPLFNVPFFRFCIARLTLLDADLLYFLAIRAPLSIVRFLNKPDRRTGFRRASLVPFRITVRPLACYRPDEDKMDGVKTRCPEEKCCTN
jgi:hypothetical protein